MKNLECLLYFSSALDFVVFYFMPFVSFLLGVFISHLIFRRRKEDVYTEKRAELVKRAEDYIRKEKMKTFSPSKAKQVEWGKEEE